MPWREVSKMDERREFVRLARQEGSNRRELCRRFGIHPDTGYKWLNRGLGVDLRDRHPAWGARKIAHCLEREGKSCPAASTVHAILRRHGRIVAPQGGAVAHLRFEKEAPNLLWQMDFKGHIALTGGGRCHPLTVIDDHSRYALALEACGNEQADTVQGRLERAFRRYGLPQAVFVDNGTPWGDASGERFTRFGVWLLKLGVGVLHSRPYHPQSRGKNERFHRTLKAEVFAFNRFRNLVEVQRALDRWRTVYNLDRPHQALDQQVPASRYRPSPRAMPDRLPKTDYDAGEIVRRVGTTKAYVSFKGRLWKVPQAFCGERLAIRSRGADGQYAVCFGAHEIASIDLTQSKCVGDVPEQVSVMSSD